MAKLVFKDVKIGQEVNMDTEPNVTLYYENTRSVTIATGETWYKRLWYMISNPFRYLFIGRVKF